MDFANLTDLFKSLLPMEAIISHLFLLLENEESKFKCSFVTFSLSEIRQILSISFLILYNESPQVYITWESNSPEIFFLLSLKKNLAHFHNSFWKGVETFILEIYLGKLFKK